MSISGCSASSAKLRRHAVLALLGNAEHAEHQHAVIRHHGPAAFGNDRRMLDAGVVARALDVIDDVVGVFLQRCS